jgi:hypothetical protein
MGSHGRWDDCFLTFTIMMIIKQGTLKCITCMNKGDELYDVPIYYTKFLNMILLDIKLKAFAMSNWRTTQSRWRSKMHLIPWITTSLLPLVATPNQCKKKCVAKASRNWKHKTFYYVKNLIIQTFSPSWFCMEGVKGLNYASKLTFDQI